MAYLVKWSLVTAKDRTGNVGYYYEGVNPVIPWLSDEDAERLIRLGAVERLDTGFEEEDPAAQDAEQVNRIEECVDALDRLEVARGSGAPRARDALRADGVKFGNDVIAAAVKVRKARPARAAATVPTTAD